MSLGSCILCFIEVAGLESCQNLGGLSVGRRKKEETKHPYLIPAIIPSHIKSEIFRHAVNGILFNILLFVYKRSLMKLTLMVNEADINGVENDLENCRITVLAAGTYIMQPR